MKQTVWVPIHGEFAKDGKKYTDEELIYSTLIWVYPFFFFDKEKARETIREREEDENIRYVDVLASYTVDTEDDKFNGHIYVLSSIDLSDPAGIHFKIAKNVHAEDCDEDEKFPFYNEDDMYASISNDIKTSVIVKSSYSCESMYNKRDGSKRWIVRDNEENRILRIYDCHCINPMCELEDVFDMIRL